MADTRAERQGGSGEDPEDDVQRMLEFAAGNDACFDTLFERWSRPLMRYLERLVHDAATAEELVQETFLRVHRARKRYRPEARFSTWLYRIGTNLAWNELRRGQRRDPHESVEEKLERGAPELASRTAAVDDTVHARRVAQGVEAAMARLPERQRAALWMVAVEGWSYAAVAVTLDSSEKAVKALVHRARSGLAAEMSQAKPQDAPLEPRT